VSEGFVMRYSRSAVLLCALLGATVPAIGQETCTPVLSTKSSGHSQVVNFQRRWTGVFAVDASRCSSTAGAFELEFVRLKDIGPDLTFTEWFAWTGEETEVRLDLTWDEWVSAHRVTEIQPCSCRR
jgi:hypothetical protein